MLEIQKKKYVHQITLNRPDLHNAFHPEMIEGITAFFKDAAKDPELRAIVLKANGKSFCAGADLNWMKEMASYSEQENKEDAIKLYEMFEAIYMCPVTVVTKAHGNVYGGGLGLLAASDIVVAEKHTKFCFSEVKWGLSPATISPFVLEKMTASAAREFMLTAKRFSALEAKDSGLVRFIGHEDEVEDYLTATVEALVENGPQAMRKTKELFSSYREKSVDKNKEFTAEVIAACRVDDEGQEGLNFFLTKEIPKWKAK